MLSIVPLLAVAAATASLFARAPLESPTRHVRTANAYVQRLLKAGYTRSPSFARLLAHLEFSNVIVHIEVVPDLPRPIDGRLLLMPQIHDFRYLRIQITLLRSADETIALIGHELQHATEVANAVEVIDESTLEKLYQRIGIEGGPHQYETIDAQNMGRQVRRELGSRVAHAAEGEQREFGDNDQDGEVEEPAA